MYVGTTLALLGVLATALFGFLLVGTAAPSPSIVLVLSFLAGRFLQRHAGVHVCCGRAFLPDRDSRFGGGPCADGVAYRRGAESVPWPGVSRDEAAPGVNLFFWFVAGCAFITVLSFFLIPSHIPQQDPPEAVRAPVAHSGASGRVATRHARTRQKPALCRR